MNPVGFREHVNTAYHGLRHIPGRGLNRYSTASRLGFGPGPVPPGRENAPPREGVRTGRSARRTDPLASI